MGRFFPKGTGTLTRFILRRDRFRIPLWLIGISFFTLMVPIAFEELYASQEERDLMAETMENPAMTAMVGPGDLANYTVGAMTAHQMLLMTSLVVGLMSILLVTRHTRTDEEAGRIEMIRSLPVGRLSNLHATWLVLILTHVLLALVTGFGLFALGIESMDLEGSLLYGATLGATGIFFTGMTAVFAQLSENSRGVIGYSVAFLLIAYLVRAVGDVGNETLSWFSPLGWLTQTEAYSTNNWWPLLLFIGGSVFLFILSSYLNAIRDLEAGFFPAKPGKEHASAFLQTPIGLAFRLQRAGMIAWAVGLFVLGLAYGSVMGDLESFFQGNEMLEQLLAEGEGYTLTEQFIPMLMIVMGILATVPPLMAMTKLRSEEKKNHTELLLSKSLSRPKLMGSYVILSVVNGLIMTSFAAIGFWLAGSAVMEEGFEFGTLFASAMVYYPAMLVMIGVAVFLIGWLPKQTGLIWFYLVYSFIVLYLGDLFQFPNWLGKLSPFGYIPQLPVDEMQWLPVISLVVIAAVFIVVGLIGYRKRDIEG